jgi:alkylation response protein AidB-like acyl-CoA dehydrogenase
VQSFVAQLVHGAFRFLTRDRWRVSGRWPFASGCQHADWILGFCIMTRDGKPLAGPTEGAPLLRGFVLPARHWQIEDSWRAAGLKGTGSHHIALGDALVPAANFFDPSRGVDCRHLRSRRRCVLRAGRRRRAL